MAEAAYRLARTYAHTRQQFGGPIERFPAVAEMVTDMKIDIEAARALSTLAAGPNAAADQGPEARTPLATTRVFELKHASPQQVDLVLKPFMAAPTASVALLPEHEALGPLGEVLTWAAAPDPSERYDAAQFGLNLSELAAILPEPASR